MLLTQFSFSKAIPTAFEVLGYDTDLFVVSLAPPPGVPKQMPKSSFGQMKFWLLDSFPRLVEIYCLLIAGLIQP